MLAPHRVQFPQITVTTSEPTFSHSCAYSVRNMDDVGVWWKFHPSVTVWAHDEYSTHLDWQPQNW